MLKTPVKPAPKIADFESRPSLANGDHLTLAEFERLYQMHPEIKKAELIEGVVYMPLPTYLAHSELHATLIGLLFPYRAATPGLRLADNQSLRLDADNEYQPDICLWIENNRRCVVRQNKILEGAPELVVEIAISSVGYDLHEKLHVYRRNGVYEYLVFLAADKALLWHVWQDGEYEQLEPDSQGVIKSVNFPGLWLNETALWAGDLANLLNTLHAGIASNDHTAFAAQVA